MDKILKGGFGYGKFCIPDELPQVVLAVVFPPLSILWNYHLGYYSIWETIQKFMICLLLTMCFYLPGLIYAINELSCKTKVKISEEKYIEKTLSEPIENRVIHLKFNVNLYYLFYNQLLFILYSIINYI